MELGYSKTQVTGQTLVRKELAIQQITENSKDAHKNIVWNYLPEYFPSSLVLFKGILECFFFQTLWNLLCLWDLENAVLTEEK